MSLLSSFSCSSCNSCLLNHCVFSSHLLRIQNGPAKRLTSNAAKPLAIILAFMVIFRRWQTNSKQNTTSVMLVMNVQILTTDYFPFSGASAIVTKFAVIDRLAYITIVTGFPVPDKPPDQPANWYPEAATAFNLTFSPRA